MPLLRQALPSLYGGVSQQSAVIRSPNQCEAAVNCSFSVATGCSKRPPLEVLSELSATLDVDNTFFHWMPHPSGARFLLAIPGDGSFLVFNTENGLRINSTSGTGNSYLTVDNPRKNLRAVTIGDTTYVTNTTVTVLMLDDVTSGTVDGVAQTLQDDALNGAADGAIYKIVGDAANAFDTYYAKNVGGRWFEWVEPSITYKLNPSTLPVTIKLSLVEVSEE